ncbi:MAG TPA: hypothetical protein PKW05_02650 [Anaerolineae bacterium]|nr:hypothetical protein [Anaerolineae bacterium]HQJ50662.1 hypothetical protein [Anaerolineae bacterium]
MTEHRPVLIVTYPELLTLLWKLRQVSLPGLEPMPLPGWSAEEVSQLVAAARDSLRKAGWLGSAGEVDPGAEELIEHCAAAGLVIRAICTTIRGAPRMFYFCVQGDRAVEHSLTVEGAHQLRWLSGHEALVERLLQIMALPELDAPEGVPAELGMDGLREAARLALSGDEAAAAATLAQSGAPTVMAEELTRTLAGAEVNGSLTVERRGADKTITGLAWVAGADMLWQVWPAQTNGARARVSRSGTAAIVNWVSGVVTETAE